MFLHKLDDKTMSIEISEREYNKLMIEIQHNNLHDKVIINAYYNINYWQPFDY